jgi:hypothetical protein
VALFCPTCKKQHCDEGEWANRPNAIHRCVDDCFGAGCGHEWQPFMIGELRSESSLMAKGKYISVGQIPKLQTLYSQYAATVFDPKKLAVDGMEREERLAWATFHTGRKIESFKQLTRAEASELIDVLLRNLRQEVTPPDRSKKKKSRDDAHAAGTAGRKNDKSKSVQLVSADDLAAIDELLTIWHGTARASTPGCARHRRRSAAKRIRRSARSPTRTRSAGR